MLAIHLSCSIFFPRFMKAQPESSQLIYNTYLELCLNDMMHKQDGTREKKDLEKKAMDLLQTGEVGLNHLCLLKR